MSQTIKELADTIRVPVSEVKAFLRREGDSGVDYRPPTLRLGAEDVRRVMDAHAAGTLSRPREVTGPEPADGAEEAIESVADRPVAERLLTLPENVGGRGGHPVFVHQEVLEWANADHPDSARRALTRLLGDFAIQGWAKNTKSVQGPGAGWKRAPLGGNHGMQFYLWYCDGADKPSKGMFPPGTVAVRQARHHDDTKNPLAIGDLGDYLRVRPADLLEGSGTDRLADPLSPAQRRAVREPSGVVLVQGHPGAGKTTSIQHMLPYLRGRTLYLTFSPALLARAQAWWAAFGTAEAPLRFMTFEDLLDALLGRSERRPLRITEAADALETKLRSRAAQLGPWVRDRQLLKHALHAELHAHAFGAALPRRFRDSRACPRPVVHETDFLQARGPTLGDPAARAAWRAVALLEEAASLLFPGPVRAFEALRALEGGPLPDGLAGLDAIVVDEVQDLTLTEIYLLAEIAARNARASGTRPRFIAAGDESQTVRPTGFQWSTLGALVHARFGEKAERVLPGNVRSPTDLALVVENARALVYGDLDRGLKPRGGAADETDESTVGRVLRVALDPANGARGLLGVLRDVPRAAVVTTDLEPPEHWRRAATAAGLEILTADAAKGLEFTTVAVIDPGSALLAQQALATREADKLSGTLARTTGDRIVVALSRATSTLLLAEAQPTPQTGKILDELCAGDDGARIEGHADVDLATLPERLDTDAADAFEIVLTEMDTADRMLESDPRSALQRLQRVRDRLGRAGATGAVSGEHRRRYFELTGMAEVLTAMEAPPDAADVESLLKNANRALRDAGRANCADAAKFLRRRAGAQDDEGHAASARDLMEFARVATLAAQEVPRLRATLERAALEWLQWLADGPLPDARASLERTRKTLDEATALLVGTFKNAPEIRDRGRARVFEHALAHRHWEIAERVMQAEGGPASDPSRATRWYEAQDRYAEAAEQQLAGGQTDAALRNLRRAGAHARALEVATQAGHATQPLLAWWSELDAVLRRKPDGALLPEEIQRLQRSLE